MKPKSLHTRGAGYKNFNPWIHVAKFLFRTSPTRILTLGPQKTLSYRGELTVEDLDPGVGNRILDSAVKVSVPEGVFFEMSRRSGGSQP